MEWIRIRPVSTVVARLYLYWPWSSSQMKAGRDPTTAKFEGRQLVHLILTKVVFTCKASGRDAVVGSAMTSVLPSLRSWSCCTGMETFG